MTRLWHKQYITKIPLQFVILLPLLGLIVLAVAMVGFLSFRNGQQAVNDVAHQLRSEINAHIEDHIDAFLHTPKQINKANAEAFSRGALDITNQVALERHFLEQIQMFDSVTSINFGNTEGGLANAGREGADGFLYVIATEGFVSGPFHKYVTDSEGRRAQLLEELPDFDARERSWYQDAVEKDTEIWSEIYILFTGQDMSVSVSRPVYDTRQQLLGVTAVNLFLSHLGNFLAGLNIGQNGQSFIMERSGYLIAASTGERPFSVVDGASAPRRITGGESTIPLTQAAAAALTDQFGDLQEIHTSQQFEFRLDGERQLGQVMAFQDPVGLDWLIVTIIPERDFMAQIYANNRNTFFLMFLTLVVIAGLSIVITRKIINPISQLNHAAGELAKGNWEQTIQHHSPIGEINTLSQSFNHMAGQLQQTVVNLTHEVAERKRSEETLQRREQEFRALAEHAPDVVARFDRNLRYLYVNPAVEQHTGIPREKFIGRTSAELNLPAEQTQLRNSTLQAVFQGGREEEMYYDHPTPTGRKYYHSRLVPEFATDGTVGTVLSIARDITAIKEMEAALYRERAKTYRMHQRSLPDELPELPGLALAASYRPAEEGQGDYYNVIRRKDQLLLYLVDIEAGRDDGVMQSLYVRKTIEDYLQAHGDDVAVSPTLVLNYLTARYRQEDRGGTRPLCVFIAVFDDPPDSGHPETLRYASSGFCTPPIMLKGSAEPDGLSVEKLYLVMDDGTDPVEHSLTIIPGSTFIFSTDGLFTQGSDSGSYELRLQEVLRNNAHLPPELIRRAVETDFCKCFSDFPQQNDLAFIVAQVPRQKQQLSFKIESDFKHIEEAKEKVAALLAQHLGHTPDLLHFHELLVNAIEHGNKGDGGKTVIVELTLTDSFYKFIITDQGEGFNWRERVNKELDWESESERGRGIIMTRMMADYLGYNERGNRVTMINILE